MNIALPSTLRWFRRLSFPAWLKPYGWLVLILILLYLIPIWVFYYLPTQDGPSHLYNAQVLTHYWDSSWGFQQFYDLRLTVFPNWLSHGFLALLIFVFPPIIAEKVLFSIFIIALPLTTFYFLDAIRPGKNPVGLLSFVFIYNYLTLMGFYSFVFSIPLILWVIGFWWKHRSELNWRAILILNLLCIAIFFGHIVAYVITIGTIAFFAIIDFPLTIFLHRIPQVSPFIRLKSLLKTFLCFLPSISLFLGYYVGSNVQLQEALTINFKRIPALLTDLAYMRVLVSYNGLQIYVAWAVAGVFGLLVLTTLFLRFFTSRPKGFVLKLADFFLLLVLILLGLYLVLPWSIGPGGWLNDRLALLAAILLLAWFDLSPESNLSLLDEGKVTPRKSISFISISSWLFAGVFVLVAVVNLGVVTYYFHLVEPDLEEFTIGTNFIRPKSVVLPIYFNGTGRYGERIGIFVNAANYYTMDNGGINLGNYEVQYDYFPVYFNQQFKTPLPVQEWVQEVHWNPDSLDLCAYASHIEYLLIWNYPSGRVWDQSRKCYQLIFEQGRQKIYIPLSK